MKLKTIAALAEVSMSTASRVMRNQGYVSPEARERVLNALAELSNSGGAGESGLPPSGIGVGIFISSDEFIYGDPGTSVDISSMRACLEARGDRVELFRRAELGEREALMLALEARKIDVAIVNDPEVDDELPRRLESLGIPVLATNGYDAAARCFVDYDNRGGALAAVRHLLALGHEEIGFITGMPGRLVSENRLEACREALGEAGLPWDPERVEPGFFKLEGGYQACTRLLERRPGTTAIFAFNDLSAIGAVRAAKEGGKRIPEDLSIVGFDDMEIASYSDPPLTTLSRFSERAKLLIAQSVENLVRDPSLVMSHVLLATKLVQRSSTGPAPDRSTPRPPA
jgi:DNA-binding LacI/PurR family transcriptional regulator